jgi:WD40 repeat protein
MAWVRYSDGRAVLLDARKNSPEAVALSDQVQVHAVGFSADSTLIATGSADHTARVWEAATGTLLATLRGHTDTIHTVRWSSDGLYLVTAGWDGVIRVWGVGNK